MSALTSKLCTKLDLQKFMGDWKVIACTPTPFESGAHNAVESYTLMPDNKIEAVFSFNKGDIFQLILYFYIQ